MLWWIYQQLRMSNVQSRLAIVEELLKSDDPEAIGPLMFALKDKDAGVRCVVAKGLRAAERSRIIRHQDAHLHRRGRAALRRRLRAGAGADAMAASRRATGGAVQRDGFARRV